MTYKDGNVVCKLLKNNNTVRDLLKQDSTTVRDIISVPIIYTKFVAESYDKLDNNYKAYFGI